MTLAKCSRGQSVKIVHIENPEIRAQAIRFGISEGEVVCCREIIPAGPVVVSKNHQEIAIGRGLANKIRIELVS